MIRTAAIFLTLAPWALADDWPQFRGPQRDAVWREAGVMQTFPAEGLKPVWRVPVASGLSSPVVAAGRVYLIDAVTADKNATERVTCYDEVIGRQLWQHTYPVTYPDWAVEPANASYILAVTPIVHGGLLHTWGNKGDLFCLAADTGKAVWHRNVMTDYGAEEFCSTPSLLIEGDLLIVFVAGKGGSTVVAFDRRTGTEAWKAVDEKRTYSSPIVITSARRRQLIVWTAQAVHSLDPATGAGHWRVPLETRTDMGISTPVFDPPTNRLLISGVMLQLDPDAAAAAILWPHNAAPTRRVLSSTSTAVIQGDHLYGARTSGKFVCLDAATGRQVWETDKVTEPKSGASAYLNPQGDSVLMYTDEGNLIRARLHPRGYEELGRTRLIEPSYPFAGKHVAWPPPAYANGHAFVRGLTEMIRVRLR